MSMLGSRRRFRQRGVLWSYIGINNEGAYAYADPIEIRIRLEGGLEDYFAGAAVEGASNEVILSNEMDSFKAGDLFWYGKLANLPAEKIANPWASPEALGLEQTWQIAQRKRIPDRRGGQVTGHHTLYVGMLGPRTNMEGKY